MNYTICKTCANPSNCSTCSFHMDRLKEHLIINGIGGRIANEGYLSPADLDDVFNTANEVLLRLTGNGKPELPPEISHYFQ